MRTPPEMNSKDQGGSTLIEVAVAMATVAILSFSVMLGFSTASTQDRQAYEVTRIQQAGVAVLEGFESTSHDWLVANEGQIEIVSASMRFVITITEVSDDLVALEVLASEEQSGNYPVRLVTLKTRKEEVSLL